MSLNIRELQLNICCWEILKIHLFMFRNDPGQSLSKYYFPYFRDLIPPRELRNCVGDFFNTRNAPLRQNIA